MTIHQRKNLPMSRWERLGNILFAIALGIAFAIIFGDALSK